MVDCVSIDRFTNLRLTSRILIGHSLDEMMQDIVQWVALCIVVCLATPPKFGQIQLERDFLG